MKHISACLNVLQVAACHCRVHETYKRCFPSAAPLLPCKVTRLQEVIKPCRCELLNYLMLHLILFFFPCSSYYFSSSALFSSPSETSYSLLFLVIPFIKLSYFVLCFFIFLPFLFFRLLWSSRPLSSFLFLNLPAFCVIFCFPLICFWNPVPSTYVFCDSAFISYPAPLQQHPRPTSVTNHHSKS